MNLPQVVCIAFKEHNAGKSNNKTYEERKEMKKGWDKCGKENVQVNVHVPSSEVFEVFAEEGEKLSSSRLHQF